MVKYKNFGSGGSPHHTVGSFSFSSQQSQHSKKEKFSDNDRQHRESPIRQEHRDEEQDELHELIRQRLFKYQRMQNRHPAGDEYSGDGDDDMDDSIIKENNGEVDSLYDIISYNGITDEHSTSVCFSDSYYDSVGETDSSTYRTFSDGNSTLSPTQRQPREQESELQEPQQQQQLQQPREQSELQEQQSTANNRFKLAYMGYVPVSPNTAAAKATVLQREDDGNSAEKEIVPNTKNDTSSSGRTSGTPTINTRTTFASIKVDDTSTTRRRQRQFANDEPLEGGILLHQQNQHPSVASFVSSPGESTVTGVGADCGSSVGASANIEEFMCTQPHRCIRPEHPQVQSVATRSHQQNNPSNGTVASSVHEQSSTTGSVSNASSVMPNSYASGHPGMSHLVMNSDQQQHRHYAAQQQQQQQQQHGQRKPTIQEYKPLSPIVSSPLPRSTASNNDAGSAFHVASPFHATSPPSTLNPQYTTTTPNIDNTRNSVLNDAAWAAGMSPPSLSHPGSPLTEQHSVKSQPNPYNHQGYFNQQHQHQHHPLYPAQSYSHYNVPHVYSNGGVPQQQPGGFTPRNPVLAQQLQAFHQYHRQQRHQQQTPQQQEQQQQQQQEQEQQQPRQQEQEKHAREEESPQNAENSSGDRRFVPVLKERDETTEVSDHQPFLLCGPDVPNLRNVQFVSPMTAKQKKDNSNSKRKMFDDLGSLASSYNGTLDGVGFNCQNLVSNLLTTCGAIVTHGYHIDGKTTAKQKRSNFEKVADQSIAGMTNQINGAPDHPVVVVHQDPRSPSNQSNSSTTNKDPYESLNDSFAKKIFYAGNNMMNNLPKDFQNLTQSAAYHNVFDTFHRYYEPGKEPEGSNLPATQDNGGSCDMPRRKDPDEQEEAQEMRNDSQQQPGFEIDTRFDEEQSNAAPDSDAQMPMSPAKSAASGKPVKAASAPTSPRSTITVQREMFRKIRARRRNRSRSPIRRSKSAPDPEIAHSPRAKEARARVLKASYETAPFKKRYARNLHNMMRGDDSEDSDAISKSQDEDSFSSTSYSWATPRSRDEFSSSKSSNHDGEGSSPSLSETISLEEQESIDKTIESQVRDDELELEEEQGETEPSPEDSLSTTSSGMSESLVGSDVDDEDDLDCLVDSSFSGEDVTVPSKDEIDALLLDSFEQHHHQHQHQHQQQPTGFLHTPLDIIEEGSKEGNEEDTVSDSSRAEYSIDRSKSSSMHGEAAEQTGVAASSEVGHQGAAVSEKQSVVSTIGLLRFGFVSMMLFQCGAMVSLWDEIADRVDATEGGPQVIETVETMFLNLKTRGTSLIASAQQILDEHNLSEIYDNDRLSSLNGMFSDIELSSSSWVDFAIDRLSKMGSKLEEGEKKQEQEQQVFQVYWESAVEVEELAELADVEFAMAVAVEVEELAELADVEVAMETENEQEEPMPVEQRRKVYENFASKIHEDLGAFDQDRTGEESQIADTEEVDLITAPTDEMETDTHASALPEDDDLVVATPAEKPKSDLEVFHELVDQLLKANDAPFDEEPVAEVVVPVTVGEKSEWVQELEETVEGV